MWIPWLTTAFSCWAKFFKRRFLGDLSLSRVPNWLTTQNCLPGHEESRGACGAVVVDVDDGDPSQAQAVVNGPLSTCGVPWWNKVREKKRLYIILLSSPKAFYFRKCMFIDCIVWVCKRLNINKVLPYTYPTHACSMAEYGIPASARAFWPKRGFRHTVIKHLPCYTTRSPSQIFRYGIFWMTEQRP